jgi:hypothetical protein
LDRGHDDAQAARDQRQIERFMGHGSAQVSAWLARHSARMVNGKFPDRAGYGFEMVDLRESRFAGRSKRASFEVPRQNAAIFSQILGELNRMQSLAIYRGTLVRLSTATRP